MEVRPVAGECPLVEVRVLRKESINEQTANKQQSTNGWSRIRRISQRKENMSTNATMSEPRNLRREHKVVSQEEWTEARKGLLSKEKELTRLRDRLAAERRALPWMKIAKDYFFDTPKGE